MKRIFVLVAAIGILSFCVYAEADATKADEEAAKSGNVKAQTALAKRYFKGEGIGQDDKEAYRWFLVAAARKDPEALHHLAMFPEEGRLEPADHKKATVLYEKAARLGYVPSQLSLAALYRKATPPALRKSVH